MNKTILLTTLLLIAAVATVSAQSLERQVIASTGGYSEANGVSLSFTVGEPVIETAVSGSVVLTQGFQQPDDITTGINDKPSVTVNYTVFPNPTANTITIDLQSDKNVEVELALYDLGGQRISMLDRKTRVEGTAQEEMDLTNLAAAQYILVLSDVNGKPLKNFKVQKID